MQVSLKEESLLRSYRRLSPGAAEGIATLVDRLAGLDENSKIDWSDEWSDSDLQEFTVSSLRRVETERPDDSR
jgi:hypothetical protein